ncbi:chorismate synthase [Anaerotalea alkaliphila]|uniref:Chorismate synthase n=1 Tax=Anaerotalea alkaliphila TaxID=2662126 RepID=A0A7X5KN25_9FIRM|nr:chorismate synthase [Anaerotalea alkaliphila]NDL67589.1 chorismate synthase [Anaerotalea alkaliphila]
MAGSSFGNVFRITTWGESHGKAIGVVVDGCPAGLHLRERDIQIELNKRRPGQSPYCSPRDESDKVEILSGVFEDKTTGTPISLIVYNKDQRSKDYSEMQNIYRPGHADHAFDLKYGFRDHRGGGRSSGRETIGRVAGGAIAKKILASFGVEITTYTKAIGPFAVDMGNFDKEEIYNNPLRMPDSRVVPATEEYLRGLIKDGNSSGGLIECRVDGMPAGIGEPVFDKLDGTLARAVMSIGAVKGVEIGSGFEAAKRTGIENNDFYRMGTGGGIQKVSNHAGGTTGGISDGSPLVLRAAVKPTPSIHKMQHAVDKESGDIDLMIGGRHDPIIVPRAVIVVESMVALTILDLMLLNMGSRMEYLERVYGGPRA